MANYLVTDSQLTSVADAIRAKTGDSGGLSFPSGMATAIGSISTGGGGSSGTDVIFYDYDGSIVQSYSAASFAQLSEMPGNPTHAGLVAQGWNWSLADAKTYVAKYGRLNIGQMYVTQSGATEIDVEMHERRLEPTLTICVNGTITVDWGDNTTPDTVTGTSIATRLDVPHTYASKGNYTISILATENNKYRFYGSSSYTILRKNSIENENRVYANTVKRIRIGNNAEIADSAFYSCSSLSSITIPDSITSIGNTTFYSCSSLSSITIPDGVISIENSVFQACYSLSSVTIPDSVTRIGTSAFSSCYPLFSITIPDSVTSIGNYAFQNCSSLSIITIPDSITSIGSGTFQACNSLSSITIQDSITSIGSSAFNSCYSLFSVAIPDDVTSIGSSMFQYCYSLSSVTIPDSVTSIGSSAFYYCSSLSNVAIPDGVTSIGGSAFYSCNSLSSITIPDGVTSISNSAFYNCSSLSSITIPDSVTSIGNSTFKNCYGAKEYHILPTTVPTGGTTMFDSLSSDCTIYVPYSADHSVLNAYGTATNWSEYATYMKEAGANGITWAEWQALNA